MFCPHYLTSIYLAISFNYSLFCVEILKVMERARLFVLTLNYNLKEQLEYLHSLYRLDCLSSREMSHIVLEKNFFPCERTEVEVRSWHSFLLYRILQDSSSHIFKLNRELFPKTIILLISTLMLLLAYHSAVDVMCLSPSIPFDQAEVGRT